MDKKTKLIFATMLLLIALLVFSALWLSQKVVSLESSTNNIATQLSNLKLPVAINGTDGLDGAQGPVGRKGSDGLNGKDGSNSISTYTKEVFYVDQPTNGKDGKNGEPGPAGPTQETRLNPETKDLETKYSTSSFWEVLIPCSELLRSCPDGSRS